MDRHGFVLGTLMLVLGLMGLFGMLVVLVVFSIGTAAIGAAAAQDADVPAALALLPTAFGLFICLAIALGTIPSLIAGYGLLRERRWGRVWALIAGVVNLPSMPFGTAVGVYAIWYFLQAETNSPAPERVWTPPEEQVQP